MADDTPSPQAAPTPPSRREGPDLLVLTAGVLTLVVTLYVLLGVSWNLQWVLAIGAVGGGILMLIASLRPRRGR